ncbi:MAG TPA: hypothetical protein VK324_11730, partial [Tepidisphaeraceae bacterium]|nr:hypothetical protein [Tepidisphaeraceae bacterium]
RAHLRVVGARDLVIAGEPGTELLGTAEATLLWVEDCHNLRLRNLCLDFDRPIYSQGTIHEVAEDRKSLTWSSDAGYPTPDDGVFGKHNTRVGVALGDGDKLLPFPHDMFNAGAWVSLGNGRWRLTCDAGNTVRQDVRAGMRMLLTIRRAPHGMVITRSNWVDLEEVHLWQAYHFASYVESSSGVSYRRSNLEPRPGSGRLGGLNADGYHARSCRFGPFYEDCRVVRVMDDCFNLHSRLVSLDDTPDERSVVLDLPADPKERRFHPEPDSREYEPGDLLAFIDPLTGDVGGWAKIVSTEPYEWRGHRQLVARLDRPVPGLRSRESVGRGCRIKYGEFLEDNFPRPVEHFVANMYAKSDGFVIRGCTLGDNTVTGGKIKASNGLIVANHTFHHGWCTWALTNELNWQEGFAPRRILVEKNRFDSWFGIFIATGYPGTKFTTGPAWACRLDIIDNVFTGVIRNELCVDINGVQGCLVTGNELTGWRPIAVGPTASDVVIRDNTCEAAGIVRR